MRHARVIPLLAALALFVGPPGAGAASNDRVGTSVFPFLKIGIGARPMGMGGALTGSADDPHAVYWNPAGLAFARRPIASTTYVSYFSGVDAGTIVFVQPVRRMAGLALAANFVRVGGLQTTTNENHTGTGLPEFSSRDLSITMAWGSRLFGRLYGGGSASFLYEAITGGDGYSATGTSFNLGLVYKSPIEGVSAGVAVRNWGYQLTLFEGAVEKLPLTFACGIAVRPFKERLLLGADVEKARDNDAGANVGAELQIVHDFFLRAGYRSLDRRVKEDSATGDLAGLSFGIGIVGTRRYRIDYAYSSFADLGDVHRITLSLVFR